MPTNQTENYLRLHLLNNEAISVLRAAFLKIVDETCDGDVDKFLSEFKLGIDKQLKSKAQRDILFPANNRPTDIKQWDVSLLCFILISCCTLEGKICINQLRALMKSQSSAHNDIDTFLGYNKVQIDQMKTKGIIDDVQYDILYPKIDKSDLNEWDLNLLLCMLAQFSSLLNKQKLKELLKNCISRDVRLYNIGAPDLKKFLKLNETKCKEMCKKGIIQQDQYNTLFPEEGYSDVNNWDDHLLQMFVTNVCLGLKQDTIAAIKVVKQIRNEMLAHKGSGEMETGEFLKTWTELFNAIEVIVKEEVPKMLREWKDKCESLNRDPFDISGAIGILIEYYSKETSEFNSVRDALQDILRTKEIENEQRVEEHKFIKDELAKLLKGQRDIAIAMQNQVGEKKDRYTVTVDVDFIEVKIHVSSGNELSKENAEKAICSSIESVLEGKQTEIKVQTVSKLTNGITKDGSKVESVERGSILLKIKCFTLKGITKLMLYMGSQELRNILTEMEAEIDDGIELGCDISDESKQHIMQELARIQDKYDGSKPLVCSRIDIDNDETKMFVDNISPEQEMDLNVKEPVFEITKTFDLSCPDDTEKCVITSCTVLPINAIVLCDAGNKNIKLYDSYCEYRSMVRLQNYPFDSCLSADDNTEVLVTVPIEGCIYRISVGDKMAIQNVINVYHACYGITCCKLGIAVLVLDKNWDVHLLNYDGRLVNRLCVALSKPIGMTSILEGTQLVISDDKLRCLKSIDIHTGEVVFVYENEDDLVHPEFVTTDGQDNIYVEDSGSNKVIMISCSGEKISEILTDVDGLVRPMGMKYNRYNDTMIIQPRWKENKMCVYRLLK